MAQKTIATLLILSAFAIAGANSASAEGGGFRAVASMMEVVASTDEASTNEAPPSSWAATGSWAATDTATTMDMTTGTESLPVTMSALSSASV